MADTRLYELEECVSPQADDILLIEESATQTDKKVKVSSLMPTDAVESAVADWLTAHPEATTTVEDGSITPVKLATSTMDLFDAKANTAGEYDDMTVGSAKQLLSKGYTENKTPYIYRASAGGDRVYEELIGGTVAWNQLLNNTSTITTNANETTSTQVESISITDGHKYIFMTTQDVAVSTYTRNSMVLIVGGNSYYSNPMIQGVNGWVFSASESNNSSSFRIWIASPNVTVKHNNFMAIDLTQMFGSIIADYIYSLEQSTAGAGVAYFRQMFPSDYYAYDTGTLQSVNVASKKVYDSNNTLVATYTFDSDLTLRGIPKLDASNNLYYDGDEYESSGKITRKYGIVDLGTLTWLYNSTYKVFYCSDDLGEARKTGVTTICSKYLAVANITDISMIQNGTCCVYSNSNVNVHRLYVKDEMYTTTSAFKTAMSGVYFVYELATPTTESADTYINPQMVHADGTEEFVDYGVEQETRDVAVPVGHESKYMINLRAKIEDAVMLPTLPTANGTYTLKCTVASGVPTLSWVAD